MAVGLKAVAARAGVSIKTVSNVVNGQRVRPETLAAVQRAVDELGYRPNLSARSLRQGRSGVIALAVPELTSPYFAELACCVITAAEQRGWTVLVDETHGAVDQEHVVLRGIRSQLIDGLIFSPLALGRDVAIPIHHEIPMVLLGERPFSGPVDHVAFDNVAAARSAVEHLVDRGRTRIATIAAQASPAGETARLRLAGWQVAVDAAGPNAAGELIVTADAWHRDDGYRATRRLLESGTRTDAIFCCNGLLAVGALRALAEAGVRVPHDVAVIGIVDIEEGRFTFPPLSTISPDKAAIAAASIDLLARRLTERAANPQTETLPQQDVRTSFGLVVRDST